MKKKRLGLVLLFIVGLSILLYPTISDKWNTYRANQIISDYAQAMAESNSDLKQILKEARQYNATLKGSSVPDAFSMRDGVQDPAYEKLLNISGDEMMGYVEIPNIDVEVPIYHYTTEEVLQKGAGHLFGSSLPVGGKGTHAVISAHRGLPAARLFTDLDRLKKGDYFYIHILDQVLAYEVDQILVVKPQETQSLATKRGKDYVTLMTCTPYAVNSHRLLVRGHRVPYEQKQYEKSRNEKTHPDMTSIAIRFGCVLIGTVIAVLIVLLLNMKNKKKKT